MHRRVFLATSATVATAALAGCGFPGGGDEEDDEDGGDDGGENGGEEESVEDRPTQPR